MTRRQRRFLVGYLTAVTVVGWVLVGGYALACVGFLAVLAGFCYVGCLIVDRYLTPHVQAALDNGDERIEAAVAEIEAFANGAVR